jgi:hypothetical protein
VESGNDYRSGVALLVAIECGVANLEIE